MSRDRGVHFRTEMISFDIQKSTAKKMSKFWRMYQMQKIKSAFKIKIRLASYFASFFH